MATRAKRITESHAGSVSRVMKPHVSECTQFHRAYGGVMVVTMSTMLGQLKQALSRNGYEYSPLPVERTGYSAGYAAVLVHSRNVPR